MRKFCLLVLLLAGWAVIFWPLYADDLARSGFLSFNAHPSENALPPAWQQTERVQLSSPAAASSLGGLPVTSSSTAGDCGDTYILQKNDSLGEIARDCDISLAELLAANPQIQNPNRVSAGQQITLPDPQAGRGGAADPAAGEVSGQGAQPGGFSPGAAVKIEAEGLPPNTPVRIGLGLSSSGYTILAQSQTGADGRVSLTLALPADARPGDTAFIMVSTRGTPSVQRMSETFVIH